ncbi:MAG: dockerin type I repeat-containing protein [Deltaproteobacteria bacterium]|nr:dockerin type I repeat-containing protein [Deltaproteobacteria bacterium]
MSLLLRAALALLLSVTRVYGACPGDCGGDGEVTVNDVVLAVSIALGGASLDQCAAADADGDGSVAVADLVAGVNALLGGCGAAPTATPSVGTPSPTATATPSATPTLTMTPAIGPRVVFFGMTSADDVLQSPIGTDPDGVPIYQRAFGFGFRLVVEAAPGASGFSVGTDSFADGDAPALQVQATRPLGNGSTDVCDVAPPLVGGVPGIDPPRFDDSAAVVDALNDLGCRFVDGTGQPQARNCAASCAKDANGDYACVDTATEAQFCVLVDTLLEFPPGDTLVTVRVRDKGRGTVAPNLGPPSRLIVRVQ